MAYLFGEKEIAAIKDVIDSKNLERYVDPKTSVCSQCEQLLKKEFASENALLVNSGTSALICALTAMGIGPGDEVIIPGFTYIATALAVLVVGAIPIIAEIDSSLTIDVSDIIKKINSRTKVIIPVHMHGLPCNMLEIMKVAKKHNILVLEDVAQACGGFFGDKKLGTIGDVGIFSFNHYKIITCGEGGAILTNNKNIYNNALIYHHGGYNFEPGQILEGQLFAGGSFRLSEISAAFLKVQLKRLSGILSNLRAEKKYILKRLNEISDIIDLCPIYDSLGDCSTAVFFQLKSKQLTQKIINDAEKNNLKIWTPNTSRHVYTDWEAVLKKKGAIHPMRNSYNFVKNSIEYSEDMCPNTVNILSSTIAISTKVDRSEKELKFKVDQLVKYLKKICNHE